MLNGFRKVSDISRKVFVALAVGSGLHDEDLPVPPCDRPGVRLFAISSHFLAQTVTTQVATDASKRLRFGDITKDMCSKHPAKFGVSSLKNEVTRYFLRWVNLYAAPCSREIFWDHRSDFGIHGHVCLQIQTVWLESAAPER